MKLPIFGIVIMVFLQLGFTAYNAVDRPMESLVAIGPITKGTNPVALNGLDEDSFYFSDIDRSYPTHRNITPLSNRHSETAIEPTLTFRKSGSAAAKSAINSSRLVAMQRPFEPITITYNREATPGGESENYQTASMRTTEGRSFASRSVGVIRKPYDWLKMLGSKLK
jgi:hypothetical protein